jgi:hypothetical protein
MAPATTLAAPCRDMSSRIAAPYGRARVRAESEKMLRLVGSWIGLLATHTFALEKQESNQSSNLHNPTPPNPPHAPPRVTRPHHTLAFWGIYYQRGPDIVATTSGFAQLPTQRAVTFVNVNLYFLHNTVRSIRGTATIEAKGSTTLPLRNSTASTVHRSLGIGAGAVVVDRNVGCFDTRATIRLAAIRMPRDRRGCEQHELKPSTRW